MVKERVRDYIYLYLQNLIAELKNELKDKVKASVIQCSDVNDVDSHSHQFQTIKDEQSVSNRLNQIINERDHLQNIPTSEMDKVIEGALVEIKNLFIYVGIATPVISNNGIDIIGISTSAPIYNVLINQNVGFKFKFNGIDCVIKSIQ